MRARERGWFDGMGGRWEGSPTPVNVIRTRIQSESEHGMTYHETVSGC